MKFSGMVYHNPGTKQFDHFLWAIILVWSQIRDFFEGILPSLCGAVSATVQNRSMQAGGPQTERIIGGSLSVSSFLPVSYRGEGRGKRGKRRGSNVKKRRRHERRGLEGLTS